VGPNARLGALGQPRANGLGFGGRIHARIRNRRQWLLGLRFTA
jgi:hypothetical protein